MKLTARQWEICRLLVLEEGGRGFSQSELCKRCGLVHFAQMHVNVRELMAQGLVSVRRVNGREKVVVATKGLKDFWAGKVTKVEGGKSAVQGAGN